EFNNFVATQLPGWMQTLVNDRVLADIGDERYDSFWVASGLDTAISRAYDGARQNVAPHLADVDAGSIHVEYIAKKQMSEQGEQALSAGDIRQIAAEKCYEQVAQWIHTDTYQPRDIGILVRTNSEARLLIDY